MIAHYVLGALAQLRRAPFTAIASVLTLALGLSCFVAAYGIAMYWKSGDAHHPAAERIVYVCIACESGQPGELASAVRLASDLKREVPELEAVARVFNGRPQELAVSSGENKAFMTAIPADPEIFDLLAFTFVEGRAGEALRGPDDVILTEDAARRLFGSASALGRTLLIDGERDATVSGVIALGSQPSFLGHEMRFDVLTNLPAEVARWIERNGFPPGMADDWGMQLAMTLARLPPSMPIEAFQSRLDAFAKRSMPRRDDGDLQFTLTAHPIGTLTTSIVDARFTMGSDLGVSAGAILTALGTLILLVACVNHSNLAAAQAQARIKEIGLRKVLGADRRQLLLQNVVESSVLVVPALALAMAIVALAAPVLRNALGVDAVLFLTDGVGGALFLILLSMAVAVAVSLWPVVVLTRARSVDALGSGRRHAATGAALPRFFIGVQFMSASFLLIVVTVAQLQHAHLRRAAFDEQGDPVVVLNDLSKSGVRFETLQNELRSVQQVREITALQFAPWSGSSASRYFSRSEAQGSNGTRAMVRPVGADYFDVFGLEALAGRVFDIARDPAGPDLLRRGMSPTEETANALLVLDRALVESLGFEDPRSAIGQTIYASDPGRFDAGRGVAVGAVLGVVETEHSRLNRGYGGTLFVFDPDHRWTQTPALRIARDDVRGAMEEITRVWSSVAPHVPLRAQFSDELFERSYAPFRAISRVFLVLSIAALVISMTGVLAVAVHVAERRKTEIGVRKTLGASTARILGMLISELSRPVLVGNLVAWPLAWGVAQLFLQLFAVRTKLSPLPFIASLAITLAIAWFVVGGQAWKAASMKPARVLRAE